MNLINFLNTFPDCLFIIKNYNGEIVYPTDRGIIDYICQMIDMNNSEYFHQYTKRWYQKDDFTYTDNGNTYFISRFFDITKYKTLAESYELDETTGIFLKKKLLREFRKYIIDAKEREEEFATIMADIDFFKKVNDTYGHQAGDKVLNQLAQILYGNLRHYTEPTTSKRESDLLGRFGGEEFLFVLKNIPCSYAFSKVDGIRKIIENTIIPYDDQAIQITCSFGVVHVSKENIHKIIINPNETDDSLAQSQILDRSEGHAKIISLADEALYRSKSLGRNRVTLIKY